MPEKNSNCQVGANALKPTERQPIIDVLWISDGTTDAPYDQFESWNRALPMPFACRAVVCSWSESILEVLMRRPNVQAVVLSTNHVQRALDCAAQVSHFRPEVALYLLSGGALDAISDEVYQQFNRIFFQGTHSRELYLAIQQGVAARFETPFFSALTQYSRKPVGVFHAMPISRGNSVQRSEWMQDFEDFYGENIFMAESSATTGGLDSLMQPKGALKKAQELAADAYGAEQTFFVTNGTSTANKIVLQGLLKPGDLVLVNRDCHKSHHYGITQCGVLPVYLDAWPLAEHGMFGAVPLKTIVDKLLEIKAAGMLDRVKMLVLTNCTFDGLVYDTAQIMEAVLAIKPDIVFLWDEAWFAFARFSPMLRQCTAMWSAQMLAEKYTSKAYAAQYRAHICALGPEEIPALPDPQLVQIRVYATQSTHKTMTSFRQGSMIHIRDAQFRGQVSAIFQEAYMTHTSTSPNYQILAALDAGRRQAHLEGFALVQQAIELAQVLRNGIQANPLLRQYFDVLDAPDLIPEELCSKHPGAPTESAAGFRLDPTKVTLSVGRTGIDGDTFKNLLMNRFQIQVNKTSRNSVLLMLHIGSTPDAIAQLMQALTQIAIEQNTSFHKMPPEERLHFTAKVDSLTRKSAPLPLFSRFHPFFVPVSKLSAGDLRKAYYFAYDDENCRHLSLKDGLKEISSGCELVSASFVTPYPPGFPVLMPGQIVTTAILEYLLTLDVREIHGFEPELGLKVFRTDKLNPLALEGGPQPSIGSVDAINNPASQATRPVFEHTYSLS